MADDDDPSGPSSFQVLHDRARELVKTGYLPRSAPDNVYGGYGTDRSCQLCGLLIRQTEIEYELEFMTSVDGSSHKRVVWFHLACHAIWEYERKQLK